MNYNFSILNEKEDTYEVEASIMLGDKEMYQITLDVVYSKIGQVLYDKNFINEKIDDIGVRRAFIICLRKFIEEKRALNKNTVSTNKLGDK